jgi:hypothetical protein
MAATLLILRLQGGEVSTHKSHWYRACKTIVCPDYVGFGKRKDLSRSCLGSMRSDLDIVFVPPTAYRMAEPPNTSLVLEYVASVEVWLWGSTLPHPRMLIAAADTVTADANRQIDALAGQVCSVTSSISQPQPPHRKRPQDSELIQATCEAKPIVSTFCGWPVMHDHSHVCLLRCNDYCEILLCRLEYR